MRIAIAGSSGFLGKALVQFLKAAHEDVICLKRGQDYFPETLKYREDVFNGLDVLINLAGENIFGYWTEKKKEAIFLSRIQTTKTLAKASLEVNTRPKVFINASAIGYYGNGGDQFLKENTPKGKSFLADVVEAWENAMPKDPSIRTVALRFGVILSKNGGALAKMLPIFRLGLGGKIGNGNQWMSFISLEDVLGIIYYVINTEISGVINVVAPKPVRNDEFTNILGEVLHRPTFCKVPEFAIKLFLGQMGEEALLFSQKVIPCRLIESHYAFCFPNLKGLLKASLS